MISSDLAPQVATSRVVALVETPGTVLRGSPAAVAVRGAVLGRTARSLVRFGSFERFLHLGLGAEERRCVCLSSDNTAHPHTTRATLCDATCLPSHTRDVINTPRPQQL